MTTTRKNLKAELHKEKNLIRVTWACSEKTEWASILANVKKLKGRKFNTPWNKSWSCPISEENITSLKGFGFEISGEVAPEPEVIEPEVQSKEFTDYLTVALPEDKVEGLYWYQKEALQFLIYFGGKGLIGLPPGTGKTFVALYYAKLFPAKRAMLVICPSSIKEQWGKECKKVLPKDSVEIIYSRTPYLPRRADIYIINWDILDAWKDVLCQLKLEIVVADEIQAIGSNMKKDDITGKWGEGSKRTAAYKEIMQAHDCCEIPMSGTPYNSKVRQFFNVLNRLAPKIFDNEWKFLNRYCGRKHTGFGIKYDGGSNLPELREKVQKVMYRREKSETSDGENPKKRIVVPMEVKDIDRLVAEQDLIYRDEDSMDEDMQEDAMLSLQRTAFPEKQDAIIKWIKTFLESGEKLVIYAWHKAVIEEIHKAFPKKSVVVNGSISAKAKEKAKMDFLNKDKIRLYIVNIATCPGIDGLQTVCNNGAFVELTTVESMIEQAEDRLDRKGQPYDVNLYYLVAKGTIDERHAELLEKSSSINNELLKGGKGQEISIVEGMADESK